MTSTGLVLVGLLTGTWTASWGGFKDSPFEGYRSRSALRTVLLASLLPVAFVLSGATAAPAYLVVVGLCVTAERLCTEWWKTFVREESQEPYAIPMRFAVGGRPVESRAVRYLVGATTVVGLLLAVCGASTGQRLLGATPWWVDVLVGATGGWLTAIGGAWKDAPIEGFSRWKFLRSPAVATAWAIVLLPFTDSWWVLAVAAGGWSVASIETYKTFLTGGRPPGKFDGKPVRFHAALPRRWCLVTHATCWGLNATVVVLLLPMGIPLAGWGPESGSLVVALFVCVGACALVLAAGAGSANVETIAADPGAGAPLRRSMRHVLLRGASR
jgi:hypothetical protein